MKTLVAALTAVLISTSALAADLYIAGTVGADVRGEKRASTGVAVGAEFNKNLRVEGAYEYGIEGKTHNVYGHVIPQVTIPGTSVTPYAIVGLGLNVEDLNGSPQYVVGAGVRTAITNKIDLDLRYRRIDTVDNSAGRDVVTTGITVKF